MVNAVASDQLRFIVLLPLLAALFHGTMIGFVRRPTPRWLIVALSGGALASSFLLAGYQFAELIAQPNAESVLHDDVYTWIGAGLGVDNLTIEFALAFDALSALLCLVVAGLGFLTQVYAAGFLEDDARDDRGFQRFFCYFDLLLFSMLLLVLADGPLLMLLGWQGVGVFSALLVGFWYLEARHAQLGAAGFVVARIGDAAFLLGAIVLFVALSGAGVPVTTFRDAAAEFPQIVSMFLPLPILGEVRVVDLVALCFLVAALAKAAQLPLPAWLPSTVVAPAPAFAFLHAAVGGTAAIYLLARFAFVYRSAPAVAELAGWAGALTALFAALASLAQDDLRRRLAYLAVGQLGWMLMAAGAGASTAALFHATTNTFSAALLLLAAGAISLALQGETSIEKLGGLRRLLPLHHGVFLIGVLAMAGVPPLGGLFSRDAVIAAAHAAELPGQGWWVRIALVGVALQAFSLWRAHSRVFYGRSRLDAAISSRLEEPAGWVMNPLYVLAVLACIAGWAGLPQVWGDLLGVPGESNSFANFLGPVLGADSPTLDDETRIRLSLQALVAALVGLSLAHLLTLRLPGVGARLAGALAWPARVFAAEDPVGAAYRRVVVRPLLAISSGLVHRGVEQRLIDATLVEGGAFGVRAVSGRWLKRFQSGFVRSYAFWMVVGAVGVVAALVR